MAEHNGLCASDHHHINRYSDCYNCVYCPSCIELESRLKEANLQISSLQYSNKLLYKELNNEATTNLGSEWIMTAVRTHLSPSNRYQKKSSRTGSLAYMESISYY
jgi:hypothetical protein